MRKIFLVLIVHFSHPQVNFGEHRVEKRVEERGEEEEDVEIIAAPKRRTASKSKAAPKKKIAKVKVESEG